ncbi:hypothetical protein FZW96_20800 [Bacillus sp. BGMRC 2118]|nr:hypothetical protein FZW96_20800 [Bacillus sp. BGMRC 2118]
MFDHQTIWQSYTPFHSSANVQEFLYRIYSRNKLEDAEKKSYNNCYPFIYYIDHGKSYFSLSEQAPLSIKPVLLFYGMTQLVKACLLTVDPEYPESTSVLAHGVSTRKRKKQSYDFLKDEVKIQKNGLFSHFAEKLFHVEHLDGEKLNMISLLKRIPELRQLFLFSYQEEVSFPLSKVREQTYLLKYNILDKYHMTEDRFKGFLNDNIKKSSLIEFDKSNHTFTISFTGGSCLSPIDCHPFYFNQQDGTYFIPSERELTTYFPEMMIHFLLLYNLSMISRYETEWWSELLQHISTKDLPFIQQFIQTTTYKIPYLISEFLHELNK